MTQAELDSSESIESEQVDAVETESPEVEEVETEEPSESSADSGESHEQKVSFTPEQQKVLDKLAAEKTYKLREAERKAAQEREDLQRQIAEYKKYAPRDERPEVPDVPDRYDFDDDTQWRQAVEKRDQTLRQAAEWDAKQAIQSEREEQLALEQARLKQKQLAEKVEDYSKRAATLGVKPDELQAAGNAVAQFGLNDHVVNAILADDHGPLITKYLHQNVTVLDQLARLDPVSAGIALAGIKAEAAKLKKTVTTAPEPVEHLRGAGAPPKGKAPKGARFE